MKNDPGGKDGAAVEGGPPAYAVESVDNALRLLLLLRRDGRLRVSAAAAELGVARSTAHRLISMLRYRGFVVQGADRAYRPGPSCAELGSAASVLGLPGLVRPHLEWLNRRTGESVNLMVRIGGEVRFIDGLEGMGMLQVGIRTGMSLPAYQVSAGKTLLAELPPDEIAKLYPPGAPGSPDPDRLARELALTRRRGYAINVEESETGLIAVGVPLRDPDGRALAGISVAAPTARLGRAQATRLVPDLQTTAARIRDDLTNLGGALASAPTGRN